MKKKIFVITIIIISSFLCAYAQENKESQEVDRVNLKGMFLLLSVRLHETDNLRGIQLVTSNMSRSTPTSTPPSLDRKSVV